MESTSQRRTLTKFDMFVLYGLVALCSLAGISGGEENKPCVDAEPVQNFNFSKNMGTWYEYGMIGWYTALTCTSHTYITASSKAVQCDMSSFLTSDHQIKRSIGIRVLDESKPGKFEMSFIPPGEKYNRTILGTDYTSFSIYYDCGNATRPHVRIVTRQPNPPQPVLDKAAGVLAPYNLSLSDVILHIQDCGKL